MPDLGQLIAKELSAVKALRHDLHAHPELGYQEHRTSGIVQDQLEAAGIQHRGGLAGGTGVLGWLPANAGPSGAAQTVALRADMDALPILEQTSLSYASSTAGVMHACGHDGHTSILLGTARVLAQVDDRPNNVLLIFQPAEESGAGGKRMCEDGVLSGKVLGRPADVAFGLHGYPYLEVGLLGTRNGPMLASTDEIRIVVHGKGGHAAAPHTGIDPVVVASHLVVALQSIASRNVDPLDSIVVTIAQFSSGTTHNVIPNTAELRGTLRALNDATRELGRRRVRETAAGVAATFGASAEVELIEGYPVTSNEPCAADRFRDVAKKAFGAGLQPDVAPVMGGEDFSYYGQHVPACFFFIGLRNVDQDSFPNLHSPEFDFNDAALPVGIEAMCRLALSS